MNGPEHYAEAEAIIRSLDVLNDPPEELAAAAAIAQVHATLATAPESDQALLAHLHNHYAVMAKPAGIMCTCDRQWRDVPTYGRHLRESVSV